MQVTPEIICGHIFHHSWVLEALGIFSKPQRFHSTNIEYDATYSNIEASNSPLSFQFVQLRGGVLVPWKSLKILISFKFKMYPKPIKCAR